jgi:hypothetical protein
MSLKTIFSDDATYAPISSTSWNNIVGTDVLFNQTVTFHQFDDATGNYPNAQQIPVVISKLGNNYCSMTIRCGDVPIASWRTMSATRVFPYVATTALPDGCFNPNASTQIGVVSGAVFDNSANPLVLRPCDFVFSIDTLGNLYYTICYTSGTSATNQWSTGWITSEKFIPSCNTSGSATVNNAYVNGTLEISNVTFIYALQ